MSKGNRGAAKLPPPRHHPRKGKAEETSKERCRWCGTKLKTKLTPRREGNKIHIETTEPVPAYCPNGCTYKKLGGMS